MKWYAMFVMTGYEHEIVRIISKYWRIGEVRPFVPMSDARFRRAGIVLSEKRRLMPGYVFLESELSGLELYQLIKPHISRTENVLKLLRYGSGDTDESFEMHEEDCAFLRKLMNDEQCIEMSKGYMKGTKTVITDGPLAGYEGLIKRVDRHKMEAALEISFFGSVREMKVGLEIVSKAS